MGTIKVDGYTSLQYLNKSKTHPSNFDSLKWYISYRLGKNDRLEKDYKADCINYKGCQYPDSVILKYSPLILTFTSEVSVLTLSTDVPKPIDNSPRSGIPTVVKLFRA